MRKMTHTGTAVGWHSGRMATTTQYPVQFAVERPDRPLNRLTTAFRPIVALPILVVLAAVSGDTSSWSSSGTRTTAAGAGGLLFLAPLLMIVFRGRYPRWWFDWNRELMRFGARVGVYLALLDDRYPSTEERQGVHLELPYPDVAGGEINRPLALVKWLLALPHYIVLAFLWLGAIVAIVIAWLAILFTGRYPPALFTYVEGVARWHVRVVAYAYVLVTDAYPPFHLGP
jgi:hypothetical protein